MNNAAQLHLIAGSTGAGKTTYAMNLSQTTGAVRFSIDEWMTRLYWMDSPSPIEYAWTIERVGRCEAMIAEQVRQLATLGIGAVLDLGFTRAEQRGRFARLAAECGLPVMLHSLELPAEERWRRVMERNSARGETYQLEVDRQMFDFMEGIWDAPDEDELRRLNGLRVGAA